MAQRHTFNAKWIKRTIFRKQAHSDYLKLKWKKKNEKKMKLKIEND